MFLFKRDGLSSSGYIKPALAGSILLVASVLPWLQDPFGKEYSAWQLPLDFGWRVGVLNYGVLCLACACFAFFRAAANWKMCHQHHAVTKSHLVGGVLAFAVVGLFLAQYLLIDFPTMDRFAQHENQMLLIFGHFGYSHTPELFAMKAFTINMSDLGMRFQLLVDQLRIGVFAAIPGVLLDFGRLRHASRPQTRRAFALIIGGCLLLLVLVSGRAVLGMIGEGQSGDAFARGDYTGALQWLDWAAFVNPDLNRSVSYHVERGQALYLLHPGQQSDDSRAYAASLLTQQRDFQGAYQLLLPVWQAEQTKQTTPWVQEQLSEVLENLVERAHAAQLQFLPQKSKNIVSKDSAALPWLRVLAQVDPGNAYAQYMQARVDYDLQDYSASNAELVNSLQLVSDEQYLSSIYTYMAFNDARMGNFVEERSMLLQAERFDPEYRNVIARGALSGLQ
jgi:hypothetical protein